MTLDADKIAALTEQELTNLESNVQRLSVTGSDKQKNEAERLAPLIAHERETRKPPPKPEKKAAPAKRAKRKTASA